MKSLVTGAVKMLPQLLNEFTKTEFKVSEITMAEFVAVFLSNPNTPQCSITTTPLLPKQVLDICQLLLTDKKISQSLSTTKDGWQILLADRKKSFIDFGFSNQGHRYLIGINGTNEQTTKVIIGCRFTQTEKFDLFKMYKKPSIERINKIANAIQPNTGLEDLS